MRFAVVLAFLAVAAAAHAAEDAPADAQTQAALAGSVVQCEAPVAIEDAAVAEAVAEAAQADAAALAARLDELPAKAAETVAMLASAHSLDRELAARAYLGAMCGQLKEKGVADAELHATLARLAEDLGLPQTAAANGLEAEGARRDIEALIAPEGVKPESAEQGETAPLEQAAEAAEPPEEAVEEAKQEAEALARMEAQREAEAKAEMEAQREADARAEAEAQREADARAEREAKRAAAQQAAETAAAEDKTETPDTGAPQPAAEEMAAAEEPSARPAADAVPAAKSSIRRKKMAPRKPKATGVGALGEDECRALGVLQDCPDLNSVMSQLLEKPLEYNHPDKMMLGRKTEISLVLRTDWKGKDAPTDVSPEMKGLPGEVKKGVSKITRIMSAELSGADFEVTPAGRQERTVILPQPVVWNWQVTPTEVGNAKPLKLRLYAHLQGPGGTMPPILVKTLDATIAVDVTTWDWMVNQAQALEPIYAIVAGILGLLTAIVTYFLTHRQAAVSGGSAEGITIRPSGPVLGDVDQSASDSKAPVHSAPLPPPPASEPEDVPWKPKKPRPDDKGGSGG